MRRTTRRLSLTVPQALADVELEALDAVLRLNLHPAIQAVQAALPRMRTNGWGRIVNISSLTILGIAERTAYAAAKAALVSSTRTWALELARTGITVNAVAPARPKQNCSAPAILRGARAKNGIWPAFPAPARHARRNRTGNSVPAVGRCWFHHRPDAVYRRRCIDRQGIALRHLASDEHDRRTASPFA